MPSSGPVPVTGGSGGSGNDPKGLGTGGPDAGPGAAAGAAAVVAIGGDGLAELLWPLRNFTVLSSTCGDAECRRKPRVLAATS